MRGPARGEKPLAFGAVGREIGIRPHLGEDAESTARIGGCRGAVELNGEMRGPAARQVAAHEVVDRAQDLRIDELHDGGLQTRCRERGGGCGGIHHRVEKSGDRRDLALDDAAQSHGRLDDDAEGALRPDHERGQVEPRDALDAAVPGGDEASVGEHDFEGEHRIARHAVLRAQQPTGVRRDVAADRGDRA